MRMRRSVSLETTTTSSPNCQCVFVPSSTASYSTVVSLLFLMGGRALRSVKLSKKQMIALLALGVCPLMPPSCTQFDHAWGFPWWQLSTLGPERMFSRQIWHGSSFYPEKGRKQYIVHEPDGITIEPRCSISLHLPLISLHPTIHPCPFHMFFDQVK